LAEVPHLEAHLNDKNIETDAARMLAANLLKSGDTSNHYVYQRVRVFLRRRHKVPSLGTAKYSDRIVFGQTGVLRLFVAKSSVS
jgi:hypothetical protein